MNPSTPVDAHVTLCQETIDALRSLPMSKKHNVSVAVERLLWSSATFRRHAELQGISKPTRKGPGRPKRGNDVDVT